MDTRVSKLANIVDDKTIIAQLIREKSSRVRLIEFKDARADIWQFFRLVCLDGTTLPYAVCVRCMKPVSYKAREGTGGLHRHPCSKQAIAANAAQGIPFSIARNRKANHKKSAAARHALAVTHAVTHSVGHSSAIAITSPIDCLRSLATIEMMSALSKERTHSEPAVEECHAYDSDQQNEHSVTSVTSEDSVYVVDYLAVSVIKLFCSQLIPLEVLESGAFMSLAQQLINVGATHGPIELSQTALNTLLHSAYESSTASLKDDLHKHAYVTLVIDVWQQTSQQMTPKTRQEPNEELKTFVTIWAISGAHSKIITTRHVPGVQSGPQLLDAVDHIRQELIGYEQQFIYLFDNSFARFDVKQDDNILFCVNHELNGVLNELFVDEVFSLAFQQLITLSATKEFPTDLSSVSADIHSPNNWSQIFQLFQLIKQYDSDISEHNSLVEIFTFLSLFAEALNSFCELKDHLLPTINLVTLWRIKLENHCKVDDSDSVALTRIKDTLRNALQKSHLNHPIFLMAVCFDPRFKKLKMLSEEQRKTTYDTIRKKLYHYSPIKQEMQEMNETVDARVETTLMVESAVESDVSKQLKDSATEAFNEYLDEVDDEQSDELERYLNLDVGQTQPLHFWNGKHSNRLPRLRLLANQILSIPAVPLRSCQFCSDGQLLSVRRKALSERYLDKMLVLYSHL